MLAEREGLRQSRLKTVLSSLAKRGTAALIPLLRISGRRVLRALIGGFEKPAPITNPARTVRRSRLECATSKIGRTLLISGR